MSLVYKSVALFVVFTVLIWVVATGLRLYISTQKAGTIIENTKPFNQEGSSKKILVLGDSIAYGTGASEPSKSLAGLVAANFKDPSVANWAKNGKRTYQLAEEITKLDEHYDLILVVVGGNDIIRPWLDLERSASSLKTVYSAASEHADQVIALTTGNFKYTTLFLPPANLYFEKRSTYLRDQAQAIAAEIPNVTYVDVVTYNEEVGFTKDMEAKDNLHLSDKGIAYWHSAIVKATNNYTFESAKKE